MAQGYRPNTHSIFDELVSIDVPDMTTFTFYNKSGRALRVLVIAFRVRMAPARNKRVRLLLQSFGSLQVHFMLPLPGMLRLSRPNSISDAFVTWMIGHP